MSYTVDEVFTRACSLIDSLTDDGIVDVNTTSDYRGRTLTLVDMSLKDLIPLFDYYTIYEIARSKIENMLGDGANFDVKDYDAYEDYTIECTNDKYGSVKGYHFETDAGSGNAYIEDYTSGWNTLATIPLTNTDISFKKYSGTVTPTAGATKSRIRFDGLYHYRITNIALYKYSFATVPTYRAWIPIQLPVDCRRIEKVTTEEDEEIYTNGTFYKIEWEGARQTIFVKWDYSGTLKVHYKPTPSKPTAFTDTLNIDDNSALAIANYLALNFVSTEQNTELRIHFQTEYERLKRIIGQKQPKTEQPILNVYGGV